MIENIVSKIEHSLTDRPKQAIAHAEIQGITSILKFRDSIEHSNKIGHFLFSELLGHASLHFWSDPKWIQELRRLFNEFEANGTPFHSQQERIDLIKQFILNPPSVWLHGHCLFLLFGDLTIVKCKEICKAEFMRCAKKSRVLKINTDVIGWDIQRTRFSSPTKECHVAKSSELRSKYLKSICKIVLEAYSEFDQEIGYVQGMYSFCSTLGTIFLDSGSEAQKWKAVYPFPMEFDEVELFVLFSNLMQKSGIRPCIADLSRMKSFSDFVASQVLWTLPELQMRFLNENSSFFSDLSMSLLSNLITFFNYNGSLEARRSFLMILGAGKFEITSSKIVEMSVLLCKEQISKMKDPEDFLIFIKDKMIEEIISDKHKLASLLSQVLKSTL